MSRTKGLVAASTVALGLAVLGPVATAAAASAATDPSATTRTVVWFVPAGFDDRWAETQLLRPAAVGCGDFQVDVYRYDTPSDVAFVDALVATGVLHSSAEDSRVFVSSTDVTSTATCAPTTPTASPSVTFSPPSARCITAGTPADSRSASVVLDNTASTEAVPFTVGGTTTTVAAGTRDTVTLPGIADAGSTVTVTAAGQSWSFPVSAATTCAATTGHTGPSSVQVGAEGSAGQSAVAPAASVSSVSPAALSSTPVAASATTAPAASLAYTGSTDAAVGSALGAGIVALGLSLVLWTRRRATARGAVEPVDDIVG